MGGERGEEGWEGKWGRRVRGEREEEGKMGGRRRVEGEREEEGEKDGRLMRERVGGESERDEEIKKKVIARKRER